MDGAPQKKKQTPKVPGSTPAVTRRTILEGVGAGFVLGMLGLKTNHEETRSPTEPGIPKTEAYQHNEGVYNDPLIHLFEPLGHAEKRGEFLYTTPNAEKYLAVIGDYLGVDAAGIIYLKVPCIGVDASGGMVRIGNEKETVILRAAGEGEVLVVRAGRSGRELGLIFYGPQGPVRATAVTMRVLHVETDGPLYIDEYSVQTLLNGRETEDPTQETESTPRETDA